MRTAGKLLIAVGVVGVITGGILWALTIKAVVQYGWLSDQVFAFEPWAFGVTPIACVIGLVGSVLAE